MASGEKMGLRKATVEGLGGPTSTPRNKDIVVLALWFGLVAGLVDATILNYTPLSGLAMRLPSDMFWISPLFDAVLFGIVALVLVGVARLFPGLPVLRSAVFLFGWLTFFDWVMLKGHIRQSAGLILAAGLAVTLMRWFQRHPEQMLAGCRKTLPWILGGVLLFWVGLEGGAWLREYILTARLSTPPPGSPNILVIVVDTLRADHLAAYGYGRMTSPNFDRIAKRGALFENVYSASSWTLPSHASLLTGHYPHDHGADVDRYDGRYPTIAQALRGEGYRTGAFSANVFYFCRARGFGPGFLHFEDFFHSWANIASQTFYGHKFNQFVTIPLGYKDVPGRKRAPEVNREFFRWIDRDPGRKFFAFLNYFDVHDPYLPPEPYRSRFANAKNPGGLIDQFNESAPQSLSQLTPEKLQGEKDAYDGAVAFVDGEIGKLFSELDVRGLTENTLVVITSDHGEELGEHGLLLHQDSLYRQEIHVPLIFWWPGRIPAGVQLQTPVTNAALPATILDLLGHGAQSVFPGPSLAQLWKTPADESAWPDLVAELAQVPYFPDKKNKVPGNYGAMKSLITSHWQYITNEKLGEELYNWKEDPGELLNLAGTPEGQQMNRELLAHLRTIVGEPLWKHEVGKQYQTKNPEVTGASPTPASPRVR
jgi:arylsulfatase A-like enzyme